MNASSEQIVWGLSHKHLTEEEAGHLQELRQLVWEVISVDDVPQKIQEKSRSEKTQIKSAK